MYLSLSEFEPIRLIFNTKFMHIHVRPMVSEDICHVHLIEEDMFPTPGSKTASDLELSKNQLYILLHNHRFVIREL